MTYERILKKFTGSVQQPITHRLCECGQNQAKLSKISLVGNNFSFMRALKALFLKGYGDFFTRKVSFYGVRSFALIRNL